MPNDDQLPAPVAVALAAANANDTEAFLDCFTADGFNGPSHFTFQAAGDKVARMTIRE
jgi:hypothetical protein